MNPVNFIFMVLYVLITVYRDQNWRSLI